MSHVTILPGCLARTLGIVGQADWPFAYTAVCPKQTILMALNINQMPEVFWFGSYKFFFYSNEGDPRERVHIHVREGRNVAKFW